MQDWGPEAWQSVRRKANNPLDWLPFIRAFTKVNDLILDPFCGSASVGVMAVKLGRRYHGGDDFIGACVLFSAVSVCFVMFGHTVCVTNPSVSLFVTAV